MLEIDLFRGHGEQHLSGNLTKALFVHCGFPGCVVRDLPVFVANRQTQIMFAQSSFRACECRPSLISKKRRRRIVKNELIAIVRPWDATTLKTTAEAVREPVFCRLVFV